MKQHHSEQIKEDKIYRNEARMGEVRNTYKILVKNPGRRRSLGRPRCKWELNITMYHKEMGCEGVFWNHLA
jgi:hypothetical protein